MYQSSFLNEYVAELDLPWIGHGEFCGRRFKTCQVWIILYINLQVISFTRWTVWIRRHTQEREREFHSSEQKISSMHEVVCVCWGIGWCHNLPDNRSIKLYCSGCHGSPGGHGPLRKVGKVVCFMFILCSSASIFWHDRTGTECEWVFFKYSGAFFSARVVLVLSVELQVTDSQRRREDKK